jgi:hypothetical protein
MADYKTHLVTSTVLGVGYGAAGYFYGQLPIETCLLAGGLCSVSGMLPDLDSDSGRPVQEMTGFAAAVVPMLMLDRFRTFGWSHETIALAAAGLYVLIRFGVAELFKRYTVHRGMWHSIPACLVCGLLTFLIVAGQDLGVRLFKSGAVIAGFLSHLVLDELWSFSLRSGRLNIKRSLGTALKFWGRDKWANVSVYAKLVVVAFLAVGDPMLMEHYGYENRFGSQTAQDVIEKALRMAGIHRGDTANR